MDPLFCRKSACWQKKGSMNFQDAPARLGLHAYGNAREFVDPLFCRKSACWLRWQRRSPRQKSVCLPFQRLTRITCSSLPKKQRPPSLHWSGQDTPFIGVKQNDQGLPPPCPSPSHSPVRSCP